MLPGCEAPLAARAHAAVTGLVASARGHLSSGPLTYRDANALAMLDMLDFRWPAFAEPPDLAQPLAVTAPSALSCGVTGPGTIPPPGSITS